MKKMYGIKNPDVENEKTILKKAKKYGLDTDNIVTVDSRHFLQALDKQGLPDCSIYDSKGKYIEYRQADTSCNAGLFGLIPALNLNTVYNQPDTLTLQEEWKNFLDLKGNAVAMPDSADFYVLSYWTVWTGKLNKDHVLVWEEMAQANKNANVKFIKVNLDIQEYWKEEEREKTLEIMSKSKSK